MWIYALISRASTMYCLEKIIVCDKSMRWIVRYAKQLTYIHLLILENPQVDIDFEKIGVARLASLTIRGCTIQNLQLPSQLLS
jgi:hypothetical protein